MKWSHKRSGEGLTGQLDFSATPKDNKGRSFPHIVCDTPLGEAVDAGIIKTPVIGRTRELIDQSDLDGVFDAVRDAFRIPGAGKLLERISAVNEFRNTYIAHHEKELTDKALAEEHLKGWVETLALLRV